MLPTTVARKVHSQGGQDGILEAIFETIGTTNKVCVEFGFNAKTLTGGSGANTARLILEEGWKGVLFDIDHANPAINLHRVCLTPENIGEVFRAHQVPLEPDYVSIDVDSVDLWLFKAMFHAGFRPRVVSVEYNSNFSVRESVTMRPGTRWNNDSCYGVSLAALHSAAGEHGYHLVAVECLFDAFFVRGDLCDPAKVPPLESFVPFTNLLQHPVPKLERRSVMMAYPSGTAVASAPWDREGSPGMARIC